MFIIILNIIFSHLVEKRIFSGSLSSHSMGRAKVVIIKTKIIEPKNKNLTNPKKADPAFLNSSSLSEIINEYINQTANVQLRMADII